jgi:hypothetical protein
VGVSVGNGVSVGAVVLVGNGVSVGSGVAVADSPPQATSKNTLSSKNIFLISLAFLEYGAAPFGPSRHATCFNQFLLSDFLTQTVLSQPEVFN